MSTFSCISSIGEGECLGLSPGPRTWILIFRYPYGVMKVLVNGRIYSKPLSYYKVCDTSPPPPHLSIVCWRVHVFVQRNKKNFEGG